jgi:alanyl-tRNA synthetase
VFTGYDEVAGSGTIRALLVDGVPVDRAETGAAVEIVLDRTPFYAQAGGQLADHGTLTTASGSVDVDDVQRPVPGLSVHRGVVTGGAVALAETAAAAVDVPRRRAISRAHTATHLVHQSLRDTLGPTATQRGSEDAPGRMRFDFSWKAAVPTDTLSAIEAEVNARVADDLTVTATELPLAEAKAQGAMALFGERYPDIVRMVSISDWSRELCGGTHTATSGQLGLVTLLGESSVGSGVRRVEALVGADAFDFLARERALVSAVSGILKTQPDTLVERVGGLVSRLAEAERELRKLRTEGVLGAAAELAAGARDIGGTRLATHTAPEGTRADDLRTLALDVRARLGDSTPVVVVTAAAADGRPAVVVALNRAAQDAGIAAGALARVAAQALGGNGGGKADLAQGGGTDPDAIPAALAAVEHALDARVPTA